MWYNKAEDYFEILEVFEDKVFVETCETGSDEPYFDFISKGDVEIAILSGEWQPLPSMIHFSKQ